MIARFSAYGFFKNQRYFEPYIILAYLSAGLSFTMIGVLTTARVVFVNLFEVPSGVAADIFGRRRTMVVALAAYVLSYAIFGTGFFLTSASETTANVGVLSLFFISEFFFSIGEAFRSGTHKSMIFDWLKRQNRANEKTAVYGTTRSWSKIGSAVCGLGSIVILLTTGEFYWLFWLSLIMTTACLINVATYPRYLDYSMDYDNEAPVDGRAHDIAKRYRDWLADFKTVIRSRSVLGLFGESMGYEGITKSVNVYIQPLLQTQAIALPVILGLSSKDKTAIFVGVAFACINVLSAIASRKSDAAAKRAGSLDRASGALWLIAFVMGFGAFVSLYYGIWWIAILCFVVQIIFENIWRPILLSRLDVVGKSKTDATTLSVEAQAAHAFIAITAIPIGYLIDQLGGDLYPVGIVCAAIALSIGLLRYSTFTRPLSQVPSDPQS